jgi:hypothetical protein
VDGVAVVVQEEDQDFAGLSLLDRMMDIHAEVYGVHTYTPQGHNSVLQRPPVADMHVET